MRKIIDGRTYNTSTAREVGAWENGRDYGDLGYCSETLYKTRRGAWFVHGEGGPQSAYSRRVDDSTIVGTSRLVAISEDEARDWVARKLDADVYEAEFGEAEEAGDLVTRQRVNVSLANGVADGLRRYSAACGTPVSRLIDQAVLATYGEQLKQY